MARPKKWRKVCCLPDNNRFGPLDVPTHKSNIITMTVDEYETIRLIDLEDLTQKVCAKQMNVSRSTIQGIYISARRKLAKALVNGSIIHIEGGEYQICNRSTPSCGKGPCRKHQIKKYTIQPHKHICTERKIP